MVFYRSCLTGAIGALVSLLAAPSATAQRVIDFGDLSLPPESFYNGADAAGGFNSGGAFFNNDFNPTWGNWGGWAFSNVTDTVTPGWGNQFAAITGGGVGPTGIHAVAFVDTFTPTIPRVILPAGEPIVGLRITNTTYAFLSMLEGDGFAKKFGGITGNDPDFFRLTITGRDAGDSPTGSVNVYLADFRFTDNSQDFILDAWTWVDLGGLGQTTRALDFTLASSDFGIWGINTPAYFALGELTVIPEPGTVALWIGLFAAIAIAISRARGNRKEKDPAR